jgi:hypothetical protein
MEPVIINDYLYNRGRGVELRTSRITVLNIFPFLRAGHTDAEILEWHPAMNAEGLAAIKEYVEQNYEQVVEWDRLADERTARAIAEQDTPEFRARSIDTRKRLIAFKDFLDSEKKLHGGVLPTSDEARQDRWKRFHDEYTKVHQEAAA